jgi:hypothetical protein
MGYGRTQEFEERLIHWIDVIERILRRQFQFNPDKPKVEILQRNFAGQ